jgi:hypothetical protein
MVFKNILTPIRLLLSGLFFLLHLLSVPAAIAQGIEGGGETTSLNVEPPVIEVIPPSPSVVEFQKYVGVPVNHYTGAPEINIPLHTLQTPQLSVPISLNYHAGGLKVGAHASWVGAGWSLNAGGMIGRTVRGKAADEAVVEQERLANGIQPIARGYFTHNYRKHNTSPTSDSLTLYEITMLNYLYAGANHGNTTIPPSLQIRTVSDRLLNEIDMQPDLFTYSFPGGSGKFHIATDYSNMLSAPKQIIHLTGSDIDINHPFGSVNPTAIAREYLDYNTDWTITDTQGIQYEFSHPEWTQSMTTCLSDGFTYDNMTGSISRSNHISAWYISRMIMDGDTITFHYIDETIEYENPRSVSEKKLLNTSPDAPTDSQTICETIIINNGKRLKLITSNRGDRIVFKANIARQDLPGSSALQQVEVYKHGQLVKAYKFDQSYFGNNSNNSDLKRLRLDSLLEVDESGQVLNLGYRFDYYSTLQSFPHRKSPYTDWWGYYSGTNNQVTSTGNVHPRFIYNKWHIARTAAAQRQTSSNLNSTLHGSLKTIYYPTGGKAEFSYELNSYYSDFAEKKRIYTTEASSSNGSLVEDYTDFTIQEDDTYVSFSIYGMEIDCTGETGEDDIIDPNDCSYGGIIVDNGSEILKKASDGFYLPFELPRSGALAERFATRIKFPAGEYRLLSKADRPEIQQARVEFEEFGPGNIRAAGLRIKQLQLFNQNGIDVMTKQYTYRSTTDSTKSSGRLLSRPFFGFRKTSYTPGGYETNSNTGEVSIPYCNSEIPSYRYINISEANVTPLAMVQGAAIGYSEVQEYATLNANTRPLVPNVEGEIFYIPARNGYTEYSFINDIDYSETNGYTRQLPFAPRPNLEYKNGRLLSKKVYSTLAPKEYRLEQEVIHNYEEVKSQAGVDEAIYSLDGSSFCYYCVGRVVEGDGTGHPYYRWYTSNGSSTWYPFTIYTKYLYPKEKLVTYYVHGANGEVSKQVQQERYTYGRYYSLPSTISTFEPELGEGRLMTYTRPLSSPALHTERKVYKINNISGTQPISDPTPAIAGERISYKGRLPKSYEKLIWKKPTGDEREIPGAEPREYVQSYVPVMKVDYSEDNEQLVVRQLVADDQGAGASVLQQKIYIWDAQHQPLAEVVNAERSEVYYNGFEETVNSSAKVGKGCIAAASVALPANELPVGDNLIVSYYWLDSNGEWQYQRQPYSGEATVGRSDAQAIDELRIHPADAQMTTYGHRPGWGITYSCDANSLATHYYYDSFGRLVKVVDHEGNLVQQQDYHYITEEQ